MCVKCKFALAPKQLPYYKLPLKQTVCTFVKKLSVRPLTPDMLTSMCSLSYRFLKNCRESSYVRNMVALIGKPRMALTDAPRKKTCAQERTASVTDIFNQSSDDSWNTTAFWAITKQYLITGYSNSVFGFLTNINLEIFCSCCCSSMFSSLVFLRHFVMFIILIALSLVVCFWISPLAVFPLLGFYLHSRSEWPNWAECIDIEHC